MMVTWILLGILLVVALIMVYSYRGLFQLNDVTTSPQAPPQFNKIKTLIGERDMEFTRSATLLNTQHYSHLKPLLLDMSVDDAFKKVIATAENTHLWEIIGVDHADHRLEAVATTPFMQYRDDVVIEVRPEANKTSSVHMRSACRVGRGDFGTNAKRIKAFFSALKQP